MDTMLMNLYKDTYADYVYDMARAYNPEEVNAAVSRWGEYEDPMEPINISFFPRRQHMITPVDGLRQSLTAIVIGGYVDRYSRQEMIALRDALEKGLYPVYDRTEGVDFIRRMKVTICDGVTVEMWELIDRWNRRHDEEDEI